MPSTKIITFLAALADFVLGGLLSNGFITAVIITEWAKSRSIAAFEQLLLSLSVCNIWVTVLITVNLIPPETTNFFHNLLTSLTYQGICIYLAFLRYWLTAWLCVFYCIKILNNTRSFFLWWKMRISRLVPWLIVGSCLISFFVCFFTELSIFRQIQSNGTANIKNITQDLRRGEIWTGFKNFFLVLGSGCPLLIAFLCCIQVVASLCHHVCQMTSKGSKFKTLQTEAHIKAARTVLSLLFLYISFYMAHTVCLILDFQQNQILVLVSFTVMLFYSSIQGIMLVLSNPKLKQRASRMLI